MIRASFSDRHPAGMITIACVALLVATIFSYYQTTQWNPEMRFWKAAAVAKSEWIDSLRKSEETPVIICLGGSATGFGIDAEYADRELGCRLVNFGLHAGMGADALTGFALSKAKKGDTVLVMLEPELLADSEIETALGVQFSHAIGEREILNWDGAAASFHLASLRPGASNIFGVIGKILMGRPMYRYQLKDMRKGGLLTTPVISRLAARNSSPESLSESAKKLLKDLVSVAWEGKIEVIYGLPWVYSDEENAHLVRRDRSKFLNDVEKIMPVIYEDGLGVSTEKINFRDSPQHLSETAARRRTERLVKILQEKFAGR